MNREAPERSLRGARGRRVLIYRDTLGTPTETFIPAQVEAMREFRGYYTGTTVHANPILPAEFVIPPGEQAVLPLWRKTLFRLTGNAPRTWMDRIREACPDLVHAHFGPDAVWAAGIASRLDVPLVATFHGHDITVRSSASLAYRTYRSVLLPRVFHRARMIIAVSGWIEKLLLEAGAPRARVRRHYIGIDVERYRSDASIPREPFVLFVGRLVEKKGAEYIIRAMRRVQERRDLGLVIVGDGPLRSSLESIAAGGNVRFLGSLSPDAVRELMNRAWALAVPSVVAANGDSEGLPIALLEGQSMGLPVVATRHSGIPEAVVDGVTGVLVPERDEHALESAIARLAGNPVETERMRAQARALMVERFNLSRQSALLEEHYREVLREAGSEVRR